MLKIKCLKTGILYRNPIPHVRSVHAIFPSVICLTNGEMLATVVLGQAFESVNLATNILRSKDMGETWQIEEPLNCGKIEPNKLISNAARITAFPDGKIVTFVIRSDRTEHPDEGLTNHRNLGFVPTELVALCSNDFGYSWTKPEIIAPPITGPSFEICSPIVSLKDGRWILPTSTWRGWDGYCPNGFRMIAFMSNDQGQTWPEYMDVMNDPNGNIVYWESKIVEFKDGRLLAVAWAYNETEHKDLPNQYAISDDGGESWSSPKSTGLLGQTLTPILVSDNHILSVWCIEEWISLGFGLISHTLKVTNGLTMMKNRFGALN